LKFQKEALKIGLDLNHAKCEIIGLTDESRSDWSSSGLHYLEPSMAATFLLGSPLYNDGFLPILNSHSASLSTMSKRLKLMSSHEAFFLYRNSLSIPKWLHLLRSSPCWETPILANVDCSQRKTIQRFSTFPYQIPLVPGIPTRSFGGLGS